MSFSLVVVDGSSKITSMWAVSINSTMIREPILSNYFSPSNEQTEYHSLCYQPCLLLPPPCLLSHAMSTICPMKIRAWQLLRGNDKNVKVMREQQISSSLPSAAARRSGVEKGRRDETSYFYSSVAPSLCLVILGLADLSTARVGRQEPKQAPRWAEGRSRGAIAAWWQS